MTWRRAALFSLCVALAGAGAAAAGGFLPEEPKLGRFLPLRPPRPAPPLSFAELDGKTLTLAAFRGKPVILNLWATWCGPCREEMPSLGRLQTALDGKLAVAAISEDRGGAEAVEKFLKKLKVASLKAYLDPKSAVGQVFGVRGLPTSIVIDREGRAVGVVEGAAKWDSPEIRDALQPFLAKEGALKSALR